MRISGCVKLSLAALLLVSLWTVNVWAIGIPVVDAGSAKSTIKDFLQRVQESKTVTDTIAFANKTSAAVGDAKKSVSEYVVKNKEKIEKKVKKVKEYKEQAEEYKEQYDEYKKWTDESIAQAKEMKAQAEAGLDQAKEMKNTAVDMAGSVDDMAKAKVGGVTDQVDGIAGKAGVDTNVSGAVSGSGSADSSANAEPAYTPPAPAATPAASRPAAASSREAFGGGAPEAAVAEDPIVDESIADEVVADEAIAEEAVVDETVPAADETSAAAEVPVVQPAAQNVQNAIAPNNNVQNMKNMGKNTRAPARRSFKNVGQISMLKPAAVYASAQVKGQLAIASAFGAVLSNDGGTDANGTVIVVPAISMTCGMMSSKKALEKDVMDDCLVKQMNDKTLGAQVYEGQDMLATYTQGKKEYAAAYIAEGYKAQNDAEKFVDDILFAIDTADTSTTTDDYSNVVEANKAVATAINDLLKIYSSRLALDAYTNYGDYKFITPQES